MAVWLAMLTMLGGLLSCLRWIALNAGYDGWQFMLVMLAVVWLYASIIGSVAAYAVYDVWLPMLAGLIFWLEMQAD
jgi:hypothetical protein